VPLKPEINSSANVFHSQALKKALSRSLRLITQILKKRRNRQTEMSFFKLSRRLRRRPASPQVIDPRDCTMRQSISDSDFFSESQRSTISSASHAAVESLVHVQLPETSEEPETCMVCRDDQHAGCVVTKLPCGHTYHSDCILQWFERKSSCPTCRYEVSAGSTQNDEREGHDLQEQLEETNSQYKTGLNLVAQSLRGDLKTFTANLDDLLAACIFERHLRS
jgi:hypothetical protein